MSEDLQTIIDRVKAGILTPENIQAFLAAMRSGQVTVATGQQAVAIGESAAESVIVTGSNNQVNRYGPTVEDIQAIVREIQSLQTQTYSTNTNQTVPVFESEPLFLSIEPQMVEVINSRLAVIEELKKAEQLSKSQQIEFDRLKGKIYSLREINRELEALSDSIDRMLQEAVASLTNKLRDLYNFQGESLLEARSQICLGEQIELLIQFQAQLGDGRIVARWLERQRSQHVAQNLGQYALEAHSDVKGSISQRRLEAFYFSIEQFLERLNHCLTWGRTNSLTNPVTPVVLDDEVYVVAFEHLKSLIPNHLPDDGIEQLKEYIDYLVQNLPNYRHISID